MKTIVCLAMLVALTVASQDTSPFQFAACKSQLLSADTGIDVRNKDWKGDQFVNVVTRPEPKPSCVRSSRWTELDTSIQPPFIVFHQTLHYRLASRKGYVKLTELYQVAPDHYVFNYSHGKDVSANIHLKWLKLIPGVLEIQYICSNDMMFLNNTKDFVLVTTPSAMFSSTVGILTKNILRRNHFKLKDLMAVRNCKCVLDIDEAKSCVNKPLLAYLK